MRVGSIVLGLVFSVLLCSLPVRAEDLATEGTGYVSTDGRTWADLGSPYRARFVGNTACATRLGQQSPIDLPYTSDGPHVTGMGWFAYGDSRIPAQTLTVSKNDHTFEITEFQHVEGHRDDMVVPGVFQHFVDWYLSNEWLGRGDRTTGRATFKLTSLHLHHPSEHLLNGVRHAMEMHLVHELTAAEHPGPRLVVAFFLDIVPDAQVRPDDRSLLRQLFALIEQADQNPVQSEVEIGAIEVATGSTLFQNLLPPPTWAPDRKQAAVAYVGSLTTPNCGGDVQWFVIAKPLAVTSAEVEAFRLHFPMNARALQTVRPETVPVGSSIYNKNDDPQPPR